MLQHLIPPFGNQALKLISKRFNQLYPQFVTNLAQYSQYDYLIELTNLPFNLLITFPNAQLKISLAPNVHLASCVISANSHDFIQLLRKVADSDALFFQQKIIIRGNIEAATALRNCLERVSCNVVDLLTPIKIPVISDFLNNYLQANKAINSVRSNALELVCPAGNPEILKAAIDAGANTVYFGFTRHGNARNFAGLNFSQAEAEAAISYAHSAGCKMLAAINAYPQAQNLAYIQETVDTAASLGVDAIILADIGILDYATQKHPQLARHVSVQASASSIESIEFYAREFGIKRLVLPRVLDLARIKEITQASQELGVEIEIFGFGGLCIMSEGRCSLSGYVTGKSPNLHGVCSPAAQINYTKEQDKLNIQLNKFTINQFLADEAACYPTLCKAKLAVDGTKQYVFEQPTSLSLLTSLAEIIDSGVKALKIEGRQRGAAYVYQVVRTFRYALDNLANLTSEQLSQLNQQLTPFMEGNQATEGAYRAQWN